MEIKLPTPYLKIDTNFNLSKQILLNELLAIVILIILKAQDKDRQAIDYICEQLNLNSKFKDLIADHILKNNNNYNIYFDSNKDINQLLIKDIQINEKVVANFNKQKYFGLECHSIVGYKKYFYDLLNKKILSSDEINVDNNSIDIDLIISQNLKEQFKEKELDLEEKIKEYYQNNDQEFYNGIKDWNNDNKLYFDNDDYSCNEDQRNYEITFNNNKPKELIKWFQENQLLEKLSDQINQWIKSDLIKNVNIHTIDDFDEIIPLNQTKDIVNESQTIYNKYFINDKRFINKVIQNDKVYTLGLAPIKIQFGIVNIPINHLVKKCDSQSIDSYILENLKENHKEIIHILDDNNYFSESTKSYLNNELINNIATYFNHYKEWYLKDENHLININKDILLNQISFDEFQKLFNKNEKLIKSVFNKNSIKTIYSMNQNDNFRKINLLNLDNIDDYKMLNLNDEDIDKLLNQFDLDTIDNQDSKILETWNKELEKLDIKINIVNDYLKTIKKQIKDKLFTEKENIINDTLRIWTKKINVEIEKVINKLYLKFNNNNDSKCSFKSKTRWLVNNNKINNDEEKRFNKIWDIRNNLNHETSYEDFKEKHKDWSITKLKEENDDYNEYSTLIMKYK